MPHCYFAPPAMRPPSTTGQSWRRSSTRTSVETTPRTTPPTCSASHAELTLGSNSNNQICKLQRVRDFPPIFRPKSSGFGCECLPGWITVQDAGYYNHIGSGVAMGAALECVKCPVGQVSSREGDGCIACPEGKEDCGGCGDGEIKGN